MLKITLDPVLQRIEERLRTFPTWLPRVIEGPMRALGIVVKENMRVVVGPHRYTGALSQSLISQYDGAQQQVTIGPTAKRGAYDAGLILELGTRPIPNAPWAPIKRWSDFRGLPAFPVWYAIRTRGVKAYPFLQETMDTSGPQLGKTAGEIVTRIAEGALGPDIPTG